MPALFIESTQGFPTDQVRVLQRAWAGSAARDVLRMTIATEPTGKMPRTRKEVLKACSFA